MKTICSITINSSDEIEQFKKFMSPTDWKFIELTTLNVTNENKSDSPNNDWLSTSCQKKIQCDILLISGHFGGTFFGKTNFKLSMLDLEEKSCQEDCRGILKKPKEVFLFGCNTLAGKEKDSRTPEEYQQVLINDGFSMAQAQQIVAFRYSAMGNSFADRMADVFDQTPRIYGFNSIAPSGETSTPLISTYFKNKNISKYYTQFNHFDGLNNTLISSFEHTSFIQEHGSILNNSDETFERPYCFLSNTKVNQTDKIKYIKSVLESNSPLDFIPFIEKYLNTLNTLNLSTEEDQILKELGNNVKLKNEFSKIQNLEGNVYLSIKVNILKLMRDLSMVSLESYEKQLFSTIKINLQYPVSNEQLDLICSLEIQADIPLNQIFDDRFKEMSFYDLVGCLSPQNLEFQKRLAEAMLSEKNLAVRRSAVLSFNQINIIPPEIIQKIVEVMVKDKNYLIRHTAENILSNHLKLDSIEIKKMISKVIQ
jgi:hypothetical protein